MEWPELPPSPYLDFHTPDNVRVRGTRIDLSLVVEDYLDGRIPEETLYQYSTLDPEAVYGIIAYYLRHSDVVDRYVACVRERADRHYQEYLRRPEPPIVAKIRALRAARKQA